MVEYLYDYLYTIKRILVVPIPRETRNDRDASHGENIVVPMGNRRRQFTMNRMKLSFDTVTQSSRCRSREIRSYRFQELDCANNDLPRFKDREEVSRERDPSISRIITTWIATPLSDVMWHETNFWYPLFLGISLSN